MKSRGFIKQQMKFKWDVFLSSHSGGWIVTAVQVRNIRGAMQAVVRPSEEKKFCVILPPAG